MSDDARVEYLTWRLARLGLAWSGYDPPFGRVERGCLRRPWPEALSRQLYQTRIETRVWLSVMLLQRRFATYPAPSIDLW